MEASPTSLSSASPTHSRLQYKTHMNHDAASRRNLFLLELIHSFLGKAFVVFFNIASYFNLILVYKWLYQAQHFYGPFLPTKTSRFRQIIHVKHIRMINQHFRGQRVIGARGRSVVKQKAHFPRSFWFYNLYRVLAYRIKTRGKRGMQADRPIFRIAEHVRSELRIG
jgi:hypothetical protein